MRWLSSISTTETLGNLLRALELDGLWEALSSCLAVVSVLEVCFYLRICMCIVKEVPVLFCCDVYMNRAYE